MDTGRIDPEDVITLTEPIEIRRMLEEAADSNPRAMVGIESAQERYESGVLEFDRSSGSLFITKPAELEESALVGKLCLVLLFPRGYQALGFTSRVLSVEDGAVRFEFPAKAFQIQRRREVRVDVPGGYDLAVKFHSSVKRGERDRRKLLDLSPGGFSFLVTSEEDAARFAVGRFVREVLFEVHGRSILFDAQIRNHHVAGENRTKVGASFIRIKPEDREFIEALCLTRMAPFVISRGFSEDPE